MANAEHLNIAEQGAGVINQWRQWHSGEILDLSGAGFTNLHLEGADLSGAVLEGATFTDCTMVRANFSKANLRGVKMSGGDAERADFAEADLQGMTINSVRLVRANFASANLMATEIHRSHLSEAIFDKAKLRGITAKDCNINTVKGLACADLRDSQLQNSTLNDTNLNGTNFSNANLDRANLSNCNMIATNLSQASLRQTVLNSANLAQSTLSKSNLSGAFLNRATLTKAIIIGTNLSGAQMSNARLDESDIKHSDFYEAQLDQAVLSHTQNVNQAKHLETVRIDHEVRYFDSLKFDVVDTHVTWEALRRFGKLPLFGASYLATIAIPLFFYGIVFYNEKIAITRAWASKQLEQDPTSTLAATVIDYLEPQPIPTLSLEIWFSAVLLGVASTIYSMACPSRIKEFSLDQWRDELGRPALHYVAHSWRHRGLRVVTFAFYVFGGVLALWVIFWKMLEVLLYILRNL